MIRNILFSLLLGSSLLFPLSLTQVQHPSSKELGCIKGIGVKKFQNIINYEKKNKVESIDDLLNIRGIGKVILNNIKENKIKKACLNPKKQKPKVKKNQRKKKEIGAE